MTPSCGHMAVELHRRGHLPGKGLCGSYILLLSHFPSTPYVSDVTLLLLGLFSLSVWWLLCVRMHLWDQTEICFQKSETITPNSQLQWINEGLLNLHLLYAHHLYVGPRCAVFPVQTYFLYTFSHIRLIHCITHFHVLIAIKIQMCLLLIFCE